MFTMDRVGKRRLLLLMYPIMILGLALTAVAFNKMVRLSVRLSSPLSQADEPDPRLLVPMQTEPSGGVLAEEFKDLYEKRVRSAASFDRSLDPLRADTSSPPLSLPSGPA